VNITPQVEEALHESGIREGLCLINFNLLTFLNGYSRRISGLLLDRIDISGG
jgi:hypothetical protein